MAGPFDEIGKGIQSAENSVGSWLKGLLPSQPAQSQNSPLPSPSVSTPLKGMSPTGGASVSGSQHGLLDYLPLGRTMGDIADKTGISEFAKQTGITDLGQNLLTTDFTKQHSALDNVNDQLMSAKDLAGQDLTQSMQALPGSQDQHARWAKAFTDPMGYVSDVLNAGVVNPVQVAANPEMWFAEDQKQGSPQDAAQTFMGPLMGNFDMGSGHNYLRDVFAPAVKAVTGEDVPHTTLFYQQQAQQLDQEGTQLEQVRGQLTDKSSQADMDAYNSKLQAWQTKVAMYQSQYNKSVDWWHNSNTSKVLGLAGQAITFPAGFAAGFITFFPSLASNPVGTAESMIGQVQQAGLFAQKLANPAERDHMSAQELAANIANVAMLAGMLSGAGKMVKGIKVPGKGNLENREVVESLQQHVPEVANPPHGPTAKVDDIANIRAQYPEATPEGQKRIADVQIQLEEAQRQLHDANEPILKKTLIEQIAGLRDEIRSLSGLPDRRSTDKATATRSAKMDYASLTDDQLEEEYNRLSNETDGSGDSIAAMNDIEKEADRRNLLLTDNQLQRSLDQRFPSSPVVTSPQNISIIDTVVNQNRKTLTGEPPKWQDAISAGAPVDYLDSRIQMYKKGLISGEELNAIVADGKREGWFMGEWRDVPDSYYENVSQKGINTLRDKDLSKALYRERLKEVGPSKTVPALNPEAPYPDYMGSATKVLGKEYLDLKPRPEDFNFNVESGSKQGVQWGSVSEFRAILDDTRFAPVPIRDLSGNGWIHPEGWAVPVSGSDYMSHEDFFTTLGIDTEESNPISDLMDAGWIKKSTVAGMVGFGVHGLDDNKVALIESAMRADYKKGVPPYPYQIADETSDRPAIEVTPQEFAATGFDLKTILDRARRFPKLYSSESSFQIDPKTIDDAVEILSNFETIDGDIVGPGKTEGWAPRPMKDVNYGFIFSDGRGIQLPSGQEHANFVAGVLRATGERSSNISSWDRIEKSLTEVHSIYGDRGQKMLFLTGPDTSLMERFLEGKDRSGIAPKEFAINGKVFRFEEFKNNDYKLDGLRPEARESYGVSQSRDFMSDLSDRGGALLGIGETAKESQIPADVTDLGAWVKAKSLVKEKDLPETIELYHGTNNISLDSIQKGHAKPTLHQLTNNIEAAFDLPIDSVWSKLMDFPRDDLTYVSTSVGEALQYARKRSAFLDEDVLPQIWKMTHQGRGSYIAKRETFDSWKDDIKDQLNLRPVITRLEMPTAYFLIKGKFNLDAISRETDNELIFENIFDSHNLPLRGGFPIEYLTGTGDGMTNEVDPSLIFNKQGEQIGKQISSETGQAGQSGEVNQAVAGRDAPEGSPPGTALTTIIQRAEGQAPIAVWKSDPPSTTSIPERERLALDGLFTAIDAALKGRSDDLNYAATIAGVKQIAKDGWTEANKRGYVQYLNGRISEKTAVFQKHINRIDPDGIIKHIIFVDEPRNQADAWFQPGQDAVYVNTSMAILSTWVKGRGQMYQDALADVVKSSGVPYEGVRALTDSLRKWNGASQEDLDLMQIGEEVAHAYDVDHDMPDEYLQGLLADQEWLGYAIRSGLSQSEKGWDQSVLGRLSAWSNGKLSSFSKEFQSMNIDLAEFNAHNLKKALGIPLTDLNYRINEVLINEIKNPSLIEEGRRIAARRYEEVSRPRVQRYVASRQEEAPTAPDTTLAVQGRDEPPTRLTSGQIRIPGVQSADATFGNTGRNASNQEGFSGQLENRQIRKGSIQEALQTAGLAGGVARPEPSAAETEQALSPAERQFLHQRQAHQIFIDLLKTGWQEANPGKRWEQFARAFVKDPASKEFTDAAAYLEKMPQKSQQAFLDLANKLNDEAINKGGGFIPAEEFDEEVPLPAKKEDVRTPEFQYFQKEIEKAEIRFAESGPVIENMRKSGAAKKDINNERAAQADLRAYIDALKSGKPPLEAKQIGRQAYTAKLNELNQPFEGSPVPELAEESVGGIVKGRKYGAIEDNIAQFISKRLAIGGYPNPRNLKDFFEGLIAGDKSSEKAYKALPSSTKEYIEAKLGYKGIPKRQKTEPIIPTEQGGAVSGTENYINPLPLVAEPGQPSLESEVAKVPEQNGFIAIRHGSTARNGGSGGQERLRGRDDIPLNDLGEKQAQRLAMAFKGKNVSVIYVSPMKRAVDTANEIAKVTGAKVIVDKNLAPWDIGDWSGKPAETHGKLLADYAINKPGERAPNGESFNDYIRRYIPAVKQHMVDALNTDGLTLEVNHTRGVRAIKAHLMSGGSGTELHPGPIQTKEEVGPGGMMGMKYDNGKWNVVTEASQAFEGQKEVPVNVAPKVVESPTDRAVENIKKDVKAIQATDSKVAKIKGEVPAKVDLTSKLDEVANDPTHPLNDMAMRAVAIRDRMLPSAQRLGGRSAEILKGDYAKALQRFTSAMAMQGKQDVKQAPISAPKVKDQATFNRTAEVAAKLRKELDAGADANDIAEKAAKQLTMTRQEALSRMKNEALGSAAASWAPAYKDLILGKAGQVIRESKLGNKPQRATLPIKLEKLLDSERPKNAVKESVPGPKKVAPKVQVKPAIVEHLKSTVTKGKAREVAPEQIHAQAKKKVSTELEQAKSKTTRELRDETKQVHEAINTPSPNPFVQGFARAVEGLQGKGTDLPEFVKERRKAGLTEPGMQINAGGGGEDEPPEPPKTPLSGWEDPREHARSFADLSDYVTRMDTFLKELTKRVAPNRNQAHPVDQAKQYIDAEAADVYRIEGIAKEMKNIISTKEVNERIRRAAEGSDDQRAEALSNLSKSEAAMAETIHAYYEATGKIMSGADRELIKYAYEGYLPHILKFDENGLELLDKKGNPRPFSPRVKYWIERQTGEDGQLIHTTIDDLINAFGENNVETDIVTGWQRHAESFVRTMRFKELIDDLSGHYISNDPLRRHMFEEHSIQPGVGGRGLQKGDFPYVGPPIVKAEEFKYVDHKYQDQLREVKLGRGARPLKNFLVYKPLAEEIERLANLNEGAGALDKAALQLSKANSIYKAYKFGFNPLHIFNLYTDVDAMSGKGLTSIIPDISLYKQIWGRVNNHLKGDEVWHTPIGDFTGDEAISQIVKSGAVIRREIVDSANLGGLQGFFAKNVPGFKAWHNFMWHDVAWKAQIGLAMHLTDKIVKETQEFRATRGDVRPVNEAEFTNIMRLATENAKYAVGFIDRKDMSRDWNLLGNTLLFANNWSLMQLRMTGRALPQGLPGAKWLGDLGGGEKYTDVITPMMKQVGGMDAQTLNFINSYDGKLARQLMVGSAMKLLITSTALAYIGSSIAAMAGQPGSQASGPYQNFQRDPTHTFDIYLGTDPATGKDKWQHNPLYGMVQEVMNYGMQAIKEVKNGGDPYSVIEAPVGRYVFGKANPMLTTGLDVMINRELNSYFAGYGDRSDITADPSVIAIQKALDAKGFGWIPAGLLDRLIYATRQVAPSPGFAPTVAKGQQLSTWGDVVNAMGPGKIAGIGDLMNALDSSSPEFGNLSRFTQFDVGNLATYLLGSRTTLTSTPAQVAEANQASQASAGRQLRDSKLTEMVNAAKKGDYNTVAQITQELGLDNNQMLNALQYPPTGSGGGITYTGTSSQNSIRQDSLLGFTLSPAQTSQFEFLKEANTRAALAQLSNSPEWKYGDNTTRAAMLSSVERDVMRAVSNQYAQELGLLGGSRITNQNIQNLIDTSIGYRGLAVVELANNPEYANSDPLEKQRMTTEYSGFAQTLAWDATFGSLAGVPPERVAQIVSNTIATEEGTRQYLKGSMFYLLGTPDERSRMLTEYSSLARTIAKRQALGQGQGPRGDEVLRRQDMQTIIQYVINTEENAKTLLHGSEYYMASDPATQKTLDTKYETLARSLAFSRTPVGDPNAIVISSLEAESSYFNLQNQFGGGNYIKLMAQQLSDMELTLRQSSRMSPKNIAVIQKELRAQFLTQNPAYAEYLKAKTNWTKNSVPGQIYNALNNSEYAAAEDLAGVPAQDSLLLSGSSSDPYFDPASNMALTDVGGGYLSPVQAMTDPSQG